MQRSVRCPLVLIVALLLCVGSLFFASAQTPINIAGLKASGGGTPTPTPTPPTAITGLLFWGEARLETYVNDDPVGTFNDQSGLNNDATASGTDRPTFKTNQANGHAALYFDGGVHFLTFPNILNGVSSAEIFMVFRVAADPPTGGDFGLWDCSTSDADTAWPYTDSNIYESWGTTVRKAAINPTPSVTSFFLYNVWSASNDWGHEINGTTLQTSGTNTVDFKTAPILGKSGDGSVLNGYIVLVLIGSPKLSAGDKTIAENYAEYWYGISIP